jgi:hypothetical protein
MSFLNIRRTNTDAHLRVTVGLPSPATSFSPCLPKRQPIAESQEERIGSRDMGNREKRIGVDLFVNSVLWIRLS